MTVKMRPRARIPLGILGVALLLFGLWLSLLSVIVGIVPSSPDPFTAGGDPCCGVPDTWAQTREWMAWGWAWLLPAMAIVVTSLLLLAGSIRGRLVRWRWLPLGIAVGMFCAVAASGITYLRLDDSPNVKQCRAIRERAAAARSSPGGVPDGLFAEMPSCGSLSPDELDLINAPPR